MSLFVLRYDKALTRSPDLYASLVGVGARACNPFGTQQSSTVTARIGSVYAERAVCPVSEFGLSYIFLCAPNKENLCVARR